MESDALNILIRGDLRLQLQRAPEIVKAVRRRTGLTQAEFSQLLDVHQSTVSLWERGVRFPHTENLEKFAKLLAVLEARWS